jgi:chromate transport protein ChrA
MGLLIVRLLLAMLFGALLIGVVIVIWKITVVSSSSYREYLEKDTSWWSVIGAIIFSIGLIWLLVNATLIACAILIFALIYRAKSIDKYEQEEQDKKSKKKHKTK